MGSCLRGRAPTALEQGREGSDCRRDADAGGRGVRGRTAAWRGAEPDIHVAKAGANGGSRTGETASILLPVEIGTMSAPSGSEAAKTFARDDERTANEVWSHRNRAYLREPCARRPRSGRRRASTGSERSERTMIPMPTGVRVWIAAGHTDMRRGMQGLALQVQEQLKRDPHGGDLYIFRGRRRRPGEDPLARRPWAVALRQAARPGKVHLAVCEGGRQCRSRRRKWPTCSKESTGGIRS